MTVQAIRLYNFMPFEDSRWIELRPITLLFGRNSSGKSAIIRAIRLLKQSLNAGSDTLRFITDQGVDLGAFDTVVHRQQPDRIMSFSFSCVIPELADLILPFINHWRRVENVPIFSVQDLRKGFSIRFGFASSAADKPAELAELQIDCLWMDKSERTLLYVQHLDSETAISLNYDWYFDSQFAGVRDMQWDFAGLDTSAEFLPVLLDFSEYNLLGTLPFGLVVELLNKCVKDFLQAIDYLGPVRPEPQRAYFLNELQRRNWNEAGLSAFSRFLSDNIDEARLTEIDRWLQYLDLATRVTHPKLLYPGKTISLSHILLEGSDPTPMQISITDTGYGIGQVFPIIVQSTTSRQLIKTDQPVRWLIIEQPELHLHPRAQAQLADLFVNVIYKVNEEYDDTGQVSATNRSLSGVCVLLETHSEHLLLRLRRRIAETSIGKNRELVNGWQNQYLEVTDLALYFVVPQKPNVSSVKELQISNFGDFTDPPDEFTGFFSDDLKETLAITRAKLDASE